MGWENFKVGPVKLRERPQIGLKISENGLLDINSKKEKFIMFSFFDFKEIVRST